MTPSHAAPAPHDAAHEAQSAARALQALSASWTARSKAARLRELLPQIEAAQAAGVKHALILESLNAHGLDLSLKSYSVMLHRLRLARTKASAGAPAAGQRPAVRDAAALARVSAVARPAAPAVPQGAAPQIKPGEPQRFDWDRLKDTPPEW